MGNYSGTVFYEFSEYNDEIYKRLTNLAKKYNINVERTSFHEEIYNIDTYGRRKDADSYHYLQNIDRYKLMRFDVNKSDSMFTINAEQKFKAFLWDANSLFADSYPTVHAYSCGEYFPI